MALWPGPFKNRAARNDSTVSKRVVACIRKERTRFDLRTNIQNGTIVRRSSQNAGCKLLMFKDRVFRFFIFVPKCCLFLNAKPQRRKAIASERDRESQNTLNT